MHLQPGSFIKIFQSGQDLAVEPDLPEFEAALWAILSCNNLDWVVTMALQQHGYGNDGWSVIYFSDLDDWDKQTISIPDDFIEIRCIGAREFTGPLIEVDRYIQLLIEVCKFQGLTEQIKKLQAFQSDRQQQVIGSILLGEPDLGVAVRLSLTDLPPDPPNIRRRIRRFIS
jgi:hypothetical protein